MVDLKRREEEEKEKSVVGLQAWMLWWARRTRWERHHWWQQMQFYRCLLWIILPTKYHATCLMMHLPCSPSSVCLRPQSLPDVGFPSARTSTLNQELLNHISLTKSTISEIRSNRNLSRGAAKWKWVGLLNQSFFVHWFKYYILSFG